METAAILSGDLEIRARGDRGQTLAGRFPYGQIATRADRGKVRKEKFEPGAFSWRLREWERLQDDAAKALAGAIDRARLAVIQDQLANYNVNILSGHSFDRPLGDLASGTARIVDSATDVRFEVDLPDEDDMPTWMLDVVKSVRANLMTGVSPGFRIPPRSVVPDAERLVPEPGNPSVHIREIRHAGLYELSIVSRPHYSGTSVDVRHDLLPAGTVTVRMPYQRRYGYRRRRWW